LWLPFYFCPGSSISADQLEKQNINLNILFQKHKMVMLTLMLANFIANVMQVNIKMHNAMVVSFN